MLVVDDVFHLEYKKMMTLGTIAIVALFGIVVTKYLTTIKLQRLSKKVLETETEVRKAKGALNVAERTKTMEDGDLKIDERRKQTLERQIDKYKKELASLKR